MNSRHPFNSRTDRSRLVFRLPSTPIEDAYNTLLEIGLYEPTVVQCIHMITEHTLGDMEIIPHRVSMKTTDVNTENSDESFTAEFKRHLQLYYFSFARDAIFAMLIYGFVPWRCQNVNAQTIVPIVLSPGTFTWDVIANDMKKETTSRYNANSAVLPLIYNVKPVNQRASKSPDVPITHIHAVFRPNNNIMEKSQFYNTPVTPIAHLIGEYKALAEARIRRSHADGWNTRARIITTSNPPKNDSNQPTRSLFDGHADGVNKMFPDPVHMQSYAAFEGGLQRMLCPSDFTLNTPIIKAEFQQDDDHKPCTYNLPPHSAVIPAPTLQPIEDIGFLTSTFQRHACTLLGVPPLMISLESNGQEQTSKGHHNTESIKFQSQSFLRKINSIRKEVEHLLSDVYFTIYGQRVDLRIVPTSSMKQEISDVSEYLALLDRIMAQANADRETSTHEEPSNTQPHLRRRGATEREIDDVVRKTNLTLLKSFHLRTQV